MPNPCSYMACDWVMHVMTFTIGQKSWCNILGCCVRHFPVQAHVSLLAPDKLMILMTNEDPPLVTVLGLVTWIITGSWQVNDLWDWRWSPSSDSLIGSLLGKHVIVYILHYTYTLIDHIRVLVGLNSSRSGSLKSLLELRLESLIRGVHNPQPPEGVLCFICKFQFLIFHGAWSSPVLLCSCHHRICWMPAF